MKRRDNLKLMALGAGLAAMPLGRVASGAPIAIYDGRFAAAHMFASDARAAHDCSSDAAALWFRQFAGRPLHHRIAGMTTVADAMVLADCARRDGLALRLTGKPRGQLVSWAIDTKDRL